MLTLTIDDPLIEHYIAEECHNNPGEFIEQIAAFIEEKRIKGSIRQAFRELRNVKNGKTEGLDTEAFLNSLDHD